MNLQKQSLLDPESCGEDLLALARRAFEIAPATCGACAGYHMRFPAMRLTGMANSLENDRALLIQAIKEAVSEPDVLQRDNVKIAILGSADTGLLAATAHAVATLGERVLGRCTFVVADLCATPLQLCKEFATHHSLSLVTHQMDFVKHPLPAAADVIILHSLLRFVPAQQRAAMLSGVADSLRRGGSLVISNHVRSPQDQPGTGLPSSRVLALSRLMRMIEDGVLVSSWPLETTRQEFEKSLSAALSRDSVISCLQDGLDLLQAAGLQPKRAEINSFPANGDSPDAGRQRFLAVASKKSG